jgi:hypothetical protein
LCSALQFWSSSVRICPMLACAGGQPRLSGTAHDVHSSERSDLSSELSGSPRGAEVRVLTDGWAPRALPPASRLSAVIAAVQKTLSIRRRRRRAVRSRARIVRLTCGGDVARPQPPLATGWSSSTRPGAAIARVGCRCRRTSSARAPTSSTQRWRGRGASWPPRLAIASTWPSWTEQPARVRAAPRRAAPHPRSPHTRRPSATPYTQRRCGGSR